MTESVKEKSILIFKKVPKKQKLMKYPKIFAPRGMIPLAVIEFLRKSMMNAN